METHGRNIIGCELSTSAGNIYRAYNPGRGKPIEPEFHEASPDEINQGLELADAAALVLRRLDSESVADFLIRIAEEILSLGDALIERAIEETALDRARLTGERERTVNQIKLFADLVKEGSWVDARIDTALPDRKPLARPDIRRMLQPIGPVIVFGASNFPLAFSVAGGDTVSALAARNPVIVKVHPSHPGTSELVATAIQRAVHAKSMPKGTFSMLHGKTAAISVALITHPKTKAVGFTGSQRAGRALFDAAARRPNPIPVYAEMGSVNPVFILPQALESRGAEIAEGLFRSVTLGVGQFCTCPGLVFGIEDNGFRSFRQKLVEAFKQATPGTMLNPSIATGYAQNLQKASKVRGVEAHLSALEAASDRTEGQPGVLVTNSITWLDNTALHEEIFGPTTLVVRCGSEAELMRAAEALEGSLTATIHGTAEELSRHSGLIDVLRHKAGRLIFNGYPTGVEVVSAMHHGGPYPATTDEKFTSVGTTAIYRFARPICYQGFPENLLPPELKNSNPRGIWRHVNGRLTREAI